MDVAEVKAGLAVDKVEPAGMVGTRVREEWGMMMMATLHSCQERLPYPRWPFTLTPTLPTFQGKAP